MIAAILTLLLSTNSPVVLRDLEGKAWAVPSSTGVECYIFILPECPIANAYAPEIKRIHAKYKDDVAFHLVQVDPKLSPTKAKKHAKDFGYNMAVLLDPDHKLLDRLGATRSPEAVVLQDGEIVYQGRIDDLYTGWGEKRPKAKSLDLRNALDSTLAGKPVEVPKTEAVGCILKH